MSRTIENVYSTIKVAKQATYSSADQLIGKGGTGIVATNGYYESGVNSFTNRFNLKSKNGGEMKRRATFEGWDFETTWGIFENVMYPYIGESVQSTKCDRMPMRGLLRT